MHLKYYKFSLFFLESTCTRFAFQEPTSGLDSSNASSLCTILKQFAKDSGKTVVASIHQPSSQIFNMFDKLLLLCDGKVAYFGEVKNCAQHFASLELPCPANYNLADHICK